MQRPQAAELEGAIRLFRPLHREALLAGNLATRLQKRIEWDAANMRAKNAPEADALIRKHYCDGFGI